MSGGQFQRLLVAFALIGNPTVLLFDEATAGTDEPGEERLNELIHRLQHEQRRWAGGDCFSAVSTMEGRSAWPCADARS